MAAVVPSDSVEELHLLADSQQDESCNYRPDVDGLRAVAVLSVVIFHAYPSLLPAGFVGVDIFFVISGFLISGIILRQLHHNRFTFSNFYSRRLRRIFPALLAMLGFTTGMACFLLLPAPLSRYANSLFASSVFGANIRFMRVTQGYFDDRSEVDFLLHLWSLGVEEQFYFVWPLLLILMYRYMTPFARWIFLALTMVASFVLSVLFSNQSGFYAPWIRFWQLGTGSALAMILDAKAIVPLAGNRSSVLGMGFLVAAVVVIRNTRPYPSWWAVLPTFAAAWLIGAGPMAICNKHLLSIRPMPEIGLISYPLYLWHWPLLALAHTLFPNESVKPWWAQPWAMLVLAFALAVATYFGIEKKLRHKKSKAIVPVLGLLMTGFAALALAARNDPIFFSHPAPLSLAELEKLPRPTPMPNGRMNLSFGPRFQKLTREKALAAKMDWLYPPEGAYLPSPSSRFFDPHTHMLHEDEHLPQSIIIFGDSHAEMISHRFAELLARAKATSQSFPTLALRTTSGAPAVPCVSMYGTDTGFFEYIEFLKRARPTVVLVASDFASWLRGPLVSQEVHKPERCCKFETCNYQTTAEVASILRGFSSGLKELTNEGIKVFVMRTVPLGDQFNPDFMVDVLGVIKSRTRPVRLRDVRLRIQEFSRKFDEAVKNANATMLDAADNLCWKGWCEVIDAVGQPSFRDSHHLRRTTARDYLDVLDIVISTALTLTQVQSVLA